MAVEEILKGVMRLPLPIQKRLLRRLRQLIGKREALGNKLIPLWRVRRDPIYYTWLNRIYQLPVEAHQELMQRLQSLIKSGEEESFDSVPLNLRRLFIFVPSWRFSVPYEDFIEARREVWQQWVRGSE